MAATRVFIETSRRGDGARGLRPPTPPDHRTTNVASLAPGPIRPMPPPAHAVLYAKMIHHIFLSFCGTPTERDS